MKKKSIFFWFMLMRRFSSLPQTLTYQVYITEQIYVYFFTYFIYDTKIITMHKKQQKTKQVNISKAKNKVNICERRAISVGTDTLTFNFFYSFLMNQALYCAGI